MKLLILFLLASINCFAQVPIKITALPATTSVSSSDPLVVVNSGITKKVTVADFMKTAVANLTGTNITGTAINGTTITGTTINATNLSSSSYVALNALAVPIVAKKQATTASIQPSSAVVYISGLDGAAATSAIDTYAGQGGVFFRRANNTAASPSALASGDVIGAITAFGHNGTDYTSTSRIAVSLEATETWNGTGQGGRFRFNTTLNGTSTSQPSFIMDHDAVMFERQENPSVETTATTLTPAKLRTKIIQYTGTAANLQMPNGTDLQSSTGSYSNMAFTFSVINTGSGTATLTVNTGVTIIGSAAVAASTSGTFRVRRTGANTYVVYRL